MLVLRRGKRQSVVIGDEITLTVEDICDGVDGPPLFGATVGFGFETPRYVSIVRSELCNRQHHSGRAAPRKPPRPGELVEIGGAVVRLRIEVPRKIPVCHNGKPTIGRDLDEGHNDEPRSPKTVHQITCHKEDRITICNNITIAALNCYRFVFTEQNFCAATR